jgi:hypothetical protein
MLLQLKYNQEVRKNASGDNLKTASQNSSQTLSPIEEENIKLRKVLAGTSILSFFMAFGDGDDLL